MAQQVFFGSRGMVDVQGRLVGAPGPVRRWNAKGKCKFCGARTSALGRVVTIKAMDRTWEALEVADGRLFVVVGDMAYLACRGAGCGRTRMAQAVLGTYRSEVPCNERCVGATGHDCECNCRGTNHGKAHSL